MKAKVTYRGCSRRRHGSVAAAIVAALLMSFIPALHAASTPVILLLEHADADKTVQTKIEAKDGLVVSPDKGKPRAKWTIRAGDALKSEVQPGDRNVGFYQGAENQTTLLFIVKVRYYRDPAGRWVPQFQLNDEPLVVRENGRWKPLATPGVAGLIAQTGTALPNAEGYFTSLEFGFTTGPASIDAWQVR